MPAKRARFVPVVTLLRRLRADDPVALIRGGRVTADGAVVTNPRALVRADARIRVRQADALRGAAKLRRALHAFGLERLDGLVVADIGAAAGGFTHALIEAGAARIYAVDVGFGQLRGWLRADPRVVDLERTNVAEIDQARIPEPLDLVTMDLSYLPLAEAVPQLHRLRLRADARLLVLVKPTFELRAGSLVTAVADRAAAVRQVTSALVASGWGEVNSEVVDVVGARGAIEVFVLARRSASGAGATPRP